MSGVTGAGGKVKPGTLPGQPTASVTTGPPGTGVEPFAPPAPDLVPKLPAVTVLKDLAATTGAATLVTPAAPKPGTNGAVAAMGDNLSVRLAAMRGADVPKTAAKISTALPMAKLSSVDTRGASGAVFDLDGGKVQGLRVNLRKIQHPELGPGMELNLKLRSTDDVTAVLAALEGKAVAGKFELQPMVEKDGRLEIGVPTQFATSAGYGAVSPGAGVQLDGDCRTLKGEGFQVDVMADAEAPQALRGKVRIRIFGKNDKELKARLEASMVQAGLKDALAPSDGVAQTRTDRMRVLWQAAPKQAQAMVASAGNADVTTVEAALREANVSDKVIAGIFRKEVFPGHVTTMNPAQVESYKKLGVEYLFGGVGSMESLMGILKSHGMMSSEERMTRGVLVTGASTWEDFRTGGADYVFLRMATWEAAGIDVASAPFAGTFQLAYKPDLLARTDWFAYAQDGYGNTADPAMFDERLYGEKLIQAIGGQNGAFSTSNEVMFQRGVSNDDLMNIFTQSEASRTALLDQLKAQGITEIAGKPVEQLVVVRMKLVDLSPDTVVARFRTALTGYCLGMTPELEKYLRDAAVMPGKLDALSTHLQNIQWNPPGVVMQQIADEIGIPAPTLAFDVKALQELARRHIESSGSLFTPEVAAFLAKIDPAKVPPSTIKQALESIAYSGGTQAFMQLARPCGITDVPKLKANANAITALFKPSCAQCGLNYTPELDTFLRALVEKGAEAQVLNGLSGSLYGQSQKAVFKALADQWGLAQPALSVNLDVVVAGAKPGVLAAGFLWSNDLDAYVKSAVEKGASPFVLMQLGTIQYADAKAALAVIAAESGLPPFELAPDLTVIKANTRAALEGAQYAWTQELEDFVALVATKGGSGLIRTLIQNVSYGDPATYLQQAATLAGVPAAPKLVADVEKILERQSASFAAAQVLLTPELTQFFKDVAAKGIAAPTISQAIAYLQYGVQEYLDTLATSSGIPAPKVSLDMVAVHGHFETAVLLAGLKYSPELRAFLDESIQKGQSPITVRQWLAQLPTMHVNEVLKSIGTAAGLTPPTVAYDKELLCTLWTTAMTTAGYTLTPAWLEFVGKVQQAGMPTHLILYALQNLQWSDTSAFTPYPSVPMPPLESTSGVVVSPPVG